MARFDLTDFEWSAIQPLLPTKVRGVKRAALATIISQTLSAVLCYRQLTRMSDVLVVNRATALNDMLGTEEGKNLLQGLKRAGNILTQAEEKDVYLVPQSAVMRDTQGTPHAWVVENDTVAVRTLEVLTSDGSNWVVTAGLEPGDRIITSGFQKTGPGAPVTVVPADGAAAGAAAGAAPGTAKQGGSN